MIYFNEQPMLIDYPDEVAKLGFSGTRDGMNPLQKRTLLKLLNDLASAVYGHYEFHHGDCVGADKQFHELIRDVEFGGNALSVRTVSHPPTRGDLRAFCVADEVREAEPFLVRNRSIVRETDRLVITPKEEEMVLRSGTWATFRYARSMNKYIYIVWPNGMMQEGHFKNKMIRMPPYE